MFFVFCLCKIVYIHVICFCICICLFKNKQITKKSSVVKVLTSIITSTRLAVTIVIMHVLTFTTVIILYLWEKNISISLMTESLQNIQGILMMHICQGSHYFEIRGRSDFSFQVLTKEKWETTGRSGESTGKSQNISLIVLLFTFAGHYLAFVCYNVLVMH